MIRTCGQTFLCIVALFGILSPQPVARLDDIQFKATHNSYRRLDLPSIQIIHYNVWEIELDFGILPDSQEFTVGHDGPEPKNGLISLRDWILDIKSAMSIIDHPIILKLEAKTRDRSGPFKRRYWAPVNEWGDWQARLRQELTDLIGDENWITPRKFISGSNGQWPSVEGLAGKWIITLQDNNDNRDIERQTDWFFVGDIPGLIAAWPDNHLIRNPTEFGRSINSGANRLIMDDAYREPWSNLFVHPPIPCYLDTAFSGLQWGTKNHPFRSFAHAINAHWTYSGIQLFGLAIAVTDTFQIPYRVEGQLLNPQNFGGDFNAAENSIYAIALCLEDLDNASTEDSIWFRINGDNGVSEEMLFCPPISNPARAGFGIGWCESQDLGELQSITLRIAGDDDIAVNQIIIICSMRCRYISDHVGWVGENHENPTTVNLISATH